MGRRRRVNHGWKSPTKRLKHKYESPQDWATELERKIAAKSLSIVPKNKT